MMVFFEDKYSQSIPILSGVPQGSILGPHLFNYYLQDFSTGLEESEAILYADDTILLSHHERPKIALDAIKLHLNAALKYYKRWGINLNFQKCELICFRNASGRGHYLAVPESKRLDLSIEGNQIPLKKSIKYLGINLQERLKMNPHARLMLNKTKAAAAKLKTLLNSNYVEQKTKILIYKTLIRPLMAYGFPIWFYITPNVALEMHKLERVIIRRCISKRKRPDGKWFSNKTIYMDSGVKPLLDYLVCLSKRRLSALQHHENPLLRNVFEENGGWSINDRYYLSPLDILGGGSDVHFSIREDDNLLTAPFYKKQAPDTYRG